MTPLTPTRRRPLSPTAPLAIGARCTTSRELEVVEMAPELLTASLPDVLPPSSPCLCTNGVRARVHAPLLYAPPHVRLERGLRRKPPPHLWGRGKVRVPSLCPSAPDHMLTGHPLFLPARAVGPPRADWNAKTTATHRRANDGHAMPRRTKTTAAKTTPHTLHKDNGHATPHD
jgi:hypothetical protein